MWGIRISSEVTGAQVDFSHYKYAMTPFLSEEVRSKVQGPQLLLYRSIQSTWTGFDHFNWSHIDAHENMFCHHNGSRIPTVYGSWLMNGSDLVDPESPDALNHWINYYAATASDQVYTYNYEGLFIDEASHRLQPSVVFGVMPDGYSDEEWRDARYAALQFIKSYLPDRVVVFNGLHSGNGAEGSLNFTDGGMWEVFAFRTSDGTYYGEDKWLEVMELAQEHSGDKFISIVSKKEGLTGDIQSRIFITASYLLVANENVVLYMSDLSYETTTILYYPEYRLDLGEPLANYTESNGLYMRSYGGGIVLVNQSATENRTYTLSETYSLVVPVGGGPVHESGAWIGTITYQTVAD